MVQGCKIDFLPLKPFQMHTPHTRLYGCHSVAMDDQVNDYLKRRIIIPCCHEEGEFVSTVFLREKKNNTFRMLLNLKELNQFIPYHHFKMDSIYHCIRLMKPSSDVTWHPLIYKMRIFLYQYMRITKST